MRKLAIVVLALIVAALSWRFTHGRSAPQIWDLAPSSPRIDSTTDAPLEPVVGTASNDRIADPAVSTPSAESSSKLVGSSVGGLRVIVRFARNDDSKPEDLDVQVLDALEESQQGRRESENEFAYTKLKPGIYTIGAEEARSMPTVQRVNLDGSGAERVVEMTLWPSRSLAVHWKTSDGRPIAQAVLDKDLESGERTMEVVASHVPLGPESPATWPLVVASIRVSANENSHYEDNDGLWALDRTSRGFSEGSLESPLDNADPTLFCTFDIRTHETLWLSAWYRGVLMDSQRIASDQTNLVFTTPLPAMRLLLVPVSLRLLDDKTGEPVTTATVDANERLRQRMKVDDRGRCTFTVQPGWKTIDIEPDNGPIPGGMRNGASLASDVQAHKAWIEGAAGRLFPVQLHALARRGASLDLGDVRLAHSRVLRFRVLGSDAEGLKSVRVAVMRKHTYDGLTGEYEEYDEEYGRDSQGPDERGFVSFVVGANETYVVLCDVGSLVSDPLIVNAALVSDDPGTIAAEIQLHASRRVSILFDPPPRPSALVLIETPTGLPVMKVDLGVMGLCGIHLGGLDYRLRLIVDDKVELTKRFSITSDPFFLTVQR
jgi:hypothetical protein